MAYAIDCERCWSWYRSLSVPGGNDTECIGVVCKVAFMPYCGRIDAVGYRGTENDEGYRETARCVCQGC